MYCKFLNEKPLTSGKVLIRSRESFCKVLAPQPSLEIISERIYKEFIEGKSIHAIVQSLNEDKLSTKKNRSAGWANSTVSRILKNEKYAGHWKWRKTKNVRDPTTGKMKKVDRPDMSNSPALKKSL